MLNGNKIQFTKLGNSSRFVIRLDYTIDCSALHSSGSVACTRISYKAGSLVPVFWYLEYLLTLLELLMYLIVMIVLVQLIIGCITSRSSSYSSKNCDDSNVCIQDTCDKISGKYLNVSISCDDGVVCTQDSCDAKKRRLHAFISGCDNDACTLYICDLINGCLEEYVQSGVLLLIVMILICISF